MFKSISQSIFRASVLSIPALALALALPITLPSVAHAQDDGKPKVVVLATKAKGGPNLKKIVKKSFEKPLSKGGAVEVLSAKAFKKGAKKAKVKGKKLKSAAGAAKAAAAAGADFLIIIEGVAEKKPTGKKKKKKKFNFAQVTVTNLSSGDVVLSERHELSGKKMPGPLAKTALESIINAVTADSGDAPADPEPAVEELPIEPPAPPGPPIGDPADETPPPIQSPP